MVTQKQKTKNEVSPIGVKNYILILISILILIIGFILLSGGGSEDSNTFNYEIFSNRRIVIAPLVLLSGFVLGIVAIMKRFK